ncbi:undecaprenyldiphospho-muramoylpentapeptide beta-N-acetylglucosaminyltransferase [Anaerosinus massiliensis]|uniref:undecaprenyldiphospho-muramoylpentapeptide beta-N-acetylglucosaminyltransferase n=1 Tax=Massilibacillus massiliensis TaxID=1806837 RepID=UPI000B3391E6|nr:undecaprenyldiphospho-muramoylpentapeptide beta-N-acetylglucosaminyltransferase [Massilibacillus massiliensis]
MRIIVSGGGTGGHIYPAITLIKTIQSMTDHCEVLYVGTKAGLEADIIPKEGLAFKTVDICGFERKLSVKNVKTIFKSMQSVWTARKIIKEFKPNVVIGTGGYVCGPVLLAASLMKIPTMIQEQNVIPGITNKILAKFVDKIAVGYNEAGQYFSPDKVVFTGNPIRQEVMSADKNAGIYKFELDRKKKTILISGGSRGARSINRAMIAVHKHFSKNSNIQLLHVTGKNEYNDIVTKLQKQGIDTEGIGNIIIKPYLYDMPQALAIADLAIFRAGAVGLAELTARGIPSILIPYPYAAENHQEYNAMIMQKKGAAIVIRDCDLSAECLIHVIDELLENDTKLEHMAKASLALGKPEAASEIAGLAINLAKQC